MIESYKCVFGQPLDLDLGRRHGPRVEIEALEFMSSLPIDWRLGDLAWRSGRRSGMHPALLGFHDLQFPRLTGGTRGLPVAEAILETRGIGDCMVMVWLRDGTCSKPLQILGQEAK